MDNTFIKIGQVIRKENWSRISYHPFIGSRNLAKSNKNGTTTIIESIGVQELHVNMDNNTVTLEQTDAIHIKLPVVRFALSSADTKVKYLIGSYVTKKSDVLTQFSLDQYNSFYVKKYGEILTKDSFITKFRNTLETGINLISDIVSKYSDDNEILEIALIMRITYNGETKSAYEFIECLDEIDEMFLKASCVENKGYIFSLAFYTMFNYGKFETRGVKTMYEGSMPYYNKEDFLSLYYARTIYNEMSFFINSDYSISIFPNYDGLNMKDIEDLMFKGKDIFNFTEICNEIQNFINRRVERDTKEKILIPIMLKFDIYYRYVLGKAGNQNMLRLNGVRYSQLLKIRDHINNEYYPKYKEKKTGKMVKRPLYWILSDLYQDYNGSSDRYMSTIIHTLQNIYQEKYVVPQQAEFCLLDRSEHLARIGDMTEFRNTWNNLFNIYKFLKTMENQNFVSELTANPSYKLGTELARFEAGWKKGRKNLKTSIERFTGNISRIIYNVEDIRNYYNDLVARMARNEIYAGDHNDLINSLRIIKDNEFEKNMFIFGYNTEKCEYKPKAETEEKPIVQVFGRANRNNDKNLLELE